MLLAMRRNRRLGRFGLAPRERQSHGTPDRREGMTGKTTSNRKAFRLGVAPKDLETLRELLEAGMVTPIVDRTVPARRGPRGHPGL
jgi:hypothetical protein